MVNDRYSKYRKPKYAVFEKEPRMNALPDMLILGDYDSFEEAEQSRIKYGFPSDNYYVKEIEYGGNN